MELQLQAGSTVVATTNFATSMFNADWQTVSLEGPGAGLVQCQVKLRGVEHLDSPSAPPAADQEATDSEHHFLKNKNSFFVAKKNCKRVVVLSVLRSQQGQPPAVQQSDQLVRQ